MEKRQFKSRFSDATNLVFEEQNIIVSVSQPGVQNLPETTSWTGMQNNNKHREFVLQVSSVKRADGLFFFFFFNKIGQRLKATINWIINTGLAVACLTCGYEHFEEQTVWLNFAHNCTSKEFSSLLLGSKYPSSGLFSFN